MAKRPTLTDITSLTNSSAINALSENWDAIEDAFDNTLSLDGSTPNALNADLDLNGNALLNVGTIDVENLTLDGQTITDITAVPEWRGAWLTATSYVKRDMVKTAGNVYICLVAHTSGTFATDLTAVKWELMVSKGDSGAGTGDMLAANNLSDLADDATARANLGLGSVATENTVPIAKGGTGATDAASAIVALGAQPLGSTLTSLEGLSLVAGDVLYATAADTLTRLPKGTAGQVLKMNSGATAPEWGAGDQWVYATPTATTSGSAFDFSGIPSTVSEIEVMLRNVSLSAGDSLRIQAIVSGSPVASGYVSYSGGTGGGLTAVGNEGTNGFSIALENASRAFSGTMRLSRYSTGNQWNAFHAGWAGGSGAVAGGGEVSLAGALEGIRLTRTGASTFDSGQWNIRYR